MSELNCISIVDYALIKLASRCNIACKYCYWFRDNDVYSHPKIMSGETLKFLASRLEDHIKQFNLKTFSLLFHGGEPMLCGVARLRDFCERLHHVSDETSCKFNLQITTNGLLLDREWIQLFKYYSIGVTISLDGAKIQHDAMRVDFAGNGTFDRVVVAIEFLRSEGIEPGLLSVCDPKSDPINLLTSIVDDLGFDGFDVLVPDATHEDNPASIAKYYMDLFDKWHHIYQYKQVSIRLIDNMLLGLLGGHSQSESVGYGPVRRLTVLPDGQMETLDVLRIIKHGFTRSKLNIKTNAIQDIEQDPLWREVLEASLNLSSDCQKCSYKIACGGGHIATRWSNHRRFDNPSVYCHDLKNIFSHIWSVVQPQLELVPQKVDTR